ncbi:Type III iodothyronine deiodinase [Mizuhopecten yessoensis]|uniref:Iodothyronine deiodinase n=1 Tax=Mizuhopecten yessoensis TaxID=6573 RepID=A0A210QDY5_MIZYE|nr:Type III iodothyronine deiodinase [Mizuhopecten yessoensis]
MVKLERFNSLVTRFTDVADFIIVYIEEAHPTDGWAFGNNIEISTHRSINDRMKAAKTLQVIGQPKCPILVDDINNTANFSYGAYYERLYIIKESLVVYEGDRGPIGYKIEEVEKWLARYVGT